MVREYEIARTAGQCRSCHKDFVGGDEFMAVLFDAGSEFRRSDFCLACWGRRDAETQGCFSFWQGRVPPPQQPAKTVVDQEVLVDFLNKLAGQEEPAKISFRFVLALMLMRKKLLMYDARGADPAGREVWKMHFRNQNETVEVVRPELDEEQIARVTEQLGQLFEASP